jgi:dipeptidyl aminopeptidase/acylaminoacyl peptidase
VGILGGRTAGATLAGVAFTPDVYRAAVDIIRPSNLLTLLDSGIGRLGRKQMYAYGGPGHLGKAWMKERSPLVPTRSNVMVVQGANDPQVNRGEAEQIVIALRNFGGVQWRRTGPRIRAARK